jgi:hypothetical protein
MLEPLKLGHSQRARFVAGAAVVLYLLASMAWVDRFPAVSQDEPWIASSGYKLATAGSLGSDLFTGFHGMERHHFVQMPIYALLEAAIVRGFGLGVVQMRALSVAFGLALLLVVYIVGREVGGDPLGAAAVVLLVIQRLTSPTEVRPIGVLLLDSARLNRYDIAVPVFGLAALWMVLRTEGQRRRVTFVLAGAFAGLSAMSHLYGSAWLPALIAVILVRDGLTRPAFRNAALLSGGFILICLPWILWIGTNASDYLAQMRTVGARFDLLAPGFYMSNVFSSDGPISIAWLLLTVRGLPLERVGSWTLAIGVPFATVLLIRRGRARSDGELALFVAAAVQFALFVAFLQVKSINYTIAIWPLGALILAWLGRDLWERRHAAIRGLVVVAATGIVAEGALSLAAAAHEARTISSYDWYEQQIRACIPGGPLVLGFQQYWLGLHEFPYRTWLLPLNMTNPSFEAKPISLDAALDRINPAIILMDRNARGLFDEAANPSHPFHYLAVGFETYRSHRSLVPRCVVRDPTYGTMEIYEVRSGLNEATQ